MLNIYTASEEELAGLEKIGQSSALRIVELHARALTVEHEPLMVMYLAKIWLQGDYWQGLIDAGTLSIQLPPTSKPIHKPVSEQRNTMNEVIMGLKQLNEKYDRLERQIGMEGEAVRIQFNSTTNCLNDYGPRLEMVENDEKDYHRLINSFEETCRSTKIYE